MKKRPYMTVQELRETYGYECSLCDHWDLDEYECAADPRFRQKRIDLSDGPNEYCHVRKKGGCERFELFKRQADSGEPIARAVDRWLSV